MKKFVLVVISIILLTILIAFNYLLWDRQNKLNSIEKLERSEASKNASINVLGREIDRLQEENKGLNQKILSLQNDYSQLQKSNKELVEENISIKDNYTKAISLLLQLSKHADKSIFIDVVSKWSDKINSKSYNEAYAMFSKDIKVDDASLDYKTFHDAFNSNPRNIKIKSVSVAEDYIDELYNNPGQIKQVDAAVPVKAVFDVSFLSNNEQKSQDYVLLGRNGFNQIIFFINYSPEKNEWEISKIKILGNNTDKDS